MKKEELSTYSSFINGKYDLPLDPTGEWKVMNPAHSDQMLGRCVYSYAQIDLAVKAAQAASVSFRTQNQAERMSVLAAAFQQIENSKAALFQISSLELGRSPNDLEVEWGQWHRWYQGFQKIETLRSEARGTTALIASSVWPLFYTLQFTFLNLLAGNAIIIKPSEQATLTTLKVIEVMTSAGSLGSAVQVLVGEKEVGRRLACHDQVQTVIFMGSFEVGMRVKQDTLSQPSKEVLLYLGAKNALVLTEESSPESAEVMDAIIQDSFLSTGQHCRSASVIFVHQKHFSAFCESFHLRAKQYKIGAPETHPFTGPLIDASMLDRYLKFSGISEREGAEVIMRGKVLSLEAKGHYVTPTIAIFNSLTADQMKKSVSLQTEISSPHISVIQYSSDEELISMMSPMQYGLAVGLWGANAGHLKKLGEALQFGQVMFNQSLLQWNPCDSFQVNKKSGNHAYHGLKLIEQLTSLKSIG